MSYTPYMMNNNYSAMTPYQQQLMYTQQMQQAQMQQAQMPVQSTIQQSPIQAGGRVDFTGAFINSYEEVKSYPVPIGSAVLLMDKVNNKFYIKVMDNSGVPLLSTYEFNEYADSSNKVKEDNNNSVVDIEGRVKALEERVDTYEKLINKNTVKVSKEV